MTHPKLTPEMLVDLMNHVFREGLSAYQQKDYKKSLIWFSQCLNMLRQFDNIEITVGRILFFIGSIHSYLHKGRKGHEQMSGFFEAMVNIFQAQTPDRGDGQKLVLVGATCFHNGHPALAECAFKTALRFFQELQLAEDIQVAETQIKQLGDVPLYRLQKRQFSIRLDKESISRFSVDVDGKVEWRQGDKSIAGVPVGVNLSWDTVCTNIVPWFLE